MMPNLAKLLRLINNIVRVGTVAEVDHAKVRCRVAVGELKTGWLKWKSERAGSTRDWSPPTVGEQVILLAPGGDLKSAIVLTGLNSATLDAPSTDPNKSLRVFPDGALIQYDHAAHVADITLPEGATLNLTCVGGINITGDVNIDGSLNATGDVADGVRSMAEDRDIFNEHTHNETSSVTKEPNQQQ